MAQPQLIQIALESGGHNAIGVSRRVGSGVAGLSGPRAAKTSSSGNRIRSEFQES